MQTRVLRHAASEFVPLGQNAAHGLAARHALVHYRSGAVYSFIPKNACTTMRLTLAFSNGCVTRREDYPWVDPNSHLFAATLRELVVTPYSFVILRCPFARLASAFLDKIVCKRPPLWALTRLKPEVFDPDTLTFRGFVDLLKERKVLNSDIHWRPQSHFLVYQDYDGWFQTEHFSTAVSVLGERIGLEIIDARPLTRHGIDQFDLDASQSYTEVPCWQLAAMQREGQAPSHGALYASDLVKTVAGLYADDLMLYIERFGEKDLLFGSLPEIESKDQPP